MDKNYWVSMHQTQKWKSWSGYAFEMLCLKHIQQIKQALGISGVNTIESSWYWYPPINSQEIGAQIDLVIDRQYKCMILSKLNTQMVLLSSLREYAKKLEHKKQLFREKTGTRKTLFTTLLTPYGVKKGEASSLVIDSEITLDALFE